MKNDPSRSAGGPALYPHLKITSEPFPRMLATRRIEDDDAEYYGAFLTRTAVRILIDLVDRTFKLRDCDIEIDGTFPVPCTQYYRRRCVAPCVSALCSRERYAERVDLVRHFLANDKRRFRAAVRDLIRGSSDELDFEHAAAYRDIFEAVERYWKQPRWQVWLNDAIDTYQVEETPQGLDLFLVTHRGRSILGRKVFSIAREDAATPDETLFSVIGAFYVTHLPKEIRVPFDFAGRAKLIERFTERFQRAAVIRVFGRTGISASRALVLSHDEHELDRARPSATPEWISRELAKMFGLTGLPSRVEAFDVAHISSTAFVAASAVWDTGRFLSAESRSILSNETSELGALAEAVAARLSDPAQSPDLLLIDGGKAQFNRVSKVLDELGNDTPVAAAVKPRGKHSSIAAFLTRDGRSINFDVDSPAHAMLQLLRDEAHDLANRVHRDYREMLPFYEKAGTTPLVVPLRFFAENGGAEDLIPIPTR